MQKPLEFTGERFVPGLPGEIAHEHWHRYAFARRFVAGKRVLDVASGEGYGSVLLATVANSVIGVDVDPGAVAHARASYARHANLRFECASAAKLPLVDACVDAVVSFETIEHLPRELQPAMLAEIARVLTPAGILLLSAPNPVEYSDARDYRNPFHLYEPTRAELDALLAVAFPSRHWFRQRRYFGSALWGEDAQGGVEVFVGDDTRVDAATPPNAMYFVVVATRTATAELPVTPGVSLFSDPAELELARVDARAADVMRLDALLRERDAALDRHSAHILHLEHLIKAREAIVVERDAQLEAAARARDTLVAERDALAIERNALADERSSALRARDSANEALGSARQAVEALEAERVRLEGALAAQERLIAYRQSLRGWLSLPWMRARLWWQRRQGL